MAITYCKTDKGVTEIETRAFRLTPRLRSTLILLDGRRSLDELRTLVSLGLDESLQTLLEGGFIEPVAVPDPVRPSHRQTPAPRPAPPPAPNADFLAVRRDVLRTINEQLGPAAESLALKIERITNANDLLPLLSAAAQLIYQVRGEQAAQAFRARFLAEE